MSEVLRNLVTFDASRQAYLPIIKEAADEQRWEILPYDDEGYALEDLTLIYEPALVAVLPFASFTQANFTGKRLLDCAVSEEIPCAVIAEEEMAYRLKLVNPNLFIPRRAGKIVNPLSSWLIALSSRQQA